MWRKALSDVARSLEAEPDVQHVVEGIVAAVTETVPGAEQAGVSLREGRILRTVAAAAQAHGVRSMLGYRLFTNGRTLGALDLYSSKLNAFDAEAEVVGELFAAHTAIALIGSTPAGRMADRAQFPRHHRDGQRNLDASRTPHRRAGLHSTVGRAVSAARWGLRSASIPWPMNTADRRGRATLRINMPVECPSSSVCKPVQAGGRSTELCTAARSFVR